MEVVLSVDSHTDRTAKRAIISLSQILLGKITNIVAWNNDLRGVEDYGVSFLIVLDGKFVSKITTLTENLDIGLKELSKIWAAELKVVNRLFAFYSYVGFRH